MCRRHRRSKFEGWMGQEQKSWNGLLLVSRIKVSSGIECGMEDTRSGLAMGGKGVMPDLAVLLSALYQGCEIFGQPCREMCSCGSQSDGTCNGTCEDRHGMFRERLSEATLLRLDKTVFTVDAGGIASDISMSFPSTESAESPIRLDLCS